MKIGNPSNYYVQVSADSWQEPPETAALYDGIFTVKLNVLVEVRFVPDATEAGPPWRRETLPPDDEDFSTTAQVRTYEIVTSSYAVTPNAELAGTVERIGTGDEPGTAFYVSPQEFSGFQAELEALTDIASDSNPTIHRDEILDRGVIRFIEDKVLGSGLLRGRHPHALGRSEPS
jgi:hypothetical protein